MSVDPLARRYTRLLYAYPRWYRRERGAEMLTTLLDAAPPDRRRPTLADTVDLVLGGLCCRLRPPRSRWLRAIAVAATLFAGLGGAATAGLVAWTVNHPVPTRAEAIDVATAALPDARRYLPATEARCDSGCPNPPTDAVTVYDDPLELDWGHLSLGHGQRPTGTDPATGHVALPIAMAHDGMPATVAGARDRLDATGWELGRLHVDGEYHLFWAAKGDLVLSFTGTGPTYQGTPAVHLDVYRTAPAATTWAALSGLVAGLLLGWLTAVRTLRRSPAQPRGRRIAIRAVGLPAVIVAAVQSVGVFALATVVADNGGWSAQDSLVPAAVLFANPVPAVVAWGGLLAAVVIASMPQRAATARAGQRPAVVPG